MYICLSLYISLSLYIYIYIYIKLVPGSVTRKSEFIHHHDHQQRGVVYRGFRLGSSTVAVSEVASGRWWCTESLFPVTCTRPGLLAADNPIAQDTMHVCVCVHGRKTSFRSRGCSHFITHFRSAHSCKPSFHRFNNRPYCCVGHLGICMR